MSSFPLSGTVSKAVLLVHPAYAQEKEFLHFLRFKLYDAGFILVREEYRRINAELADKLCVQIDYTPSFMYRQVGDGTVGEAGSYTIPDSMMPTPADMVGNAYVYVLAHRDCHHELQKFLVEKLFSDEAAGEECGASVEEGSAVSYNALLAAISAKKLDQVEVETENNYSVTAATRPPPAVFLNRTADGARKSVSLLFPRMLSADVPTAVQSREYIQANLKAALLPTLTELSKKKPEDPLRWLAEQLLTNNPSSPPMVNEGA